MDKKMISKIALGTWSWGSGAVGGDQVFGNHLNNAKLKPVFEALDTGVDTKGSWENPII